MRVPAALLCLAVFLTACADQPTAPDGDAPPEGQLAAVVGGGAAPTYFTIRLDFRRCARPYCQGVFVAPLNQRGMRCADGRHAAQCYAAEVDWTAAGVDEGELWAEVGFSGWAVVQGEYTSREVMGVPEMGYFTAAAAWTSADGAGPGAPVFRVAATDRACRGGPCPPYDAKLLNRHRILRVSALDLGAVPDPDGEVQAALLAGRLLLVGASGHGRAGGVVFVGTRALLPY